MSEEGGESRSVGAFLLGFLTGVLVCVGIGGGFFLVVGRQAAMRAEMARRDAEVFQLHAEKVRAVAAAEQQRVEENERKANEAAEKLRKEKEAAAEKVKKEAKEKLQKEAEEFRKAVEKLEKAEKGQ